MSQNPGADERRVRALLVAREVGPDAIPPTPTARPRDWLDELLASDPEPAPVVEEAQPEPPAPAAPPARKQPAKKTKKGGKKQRHPKPGAPRTAWDTRPASPRQSLIEAWDAVPYRLKWLAYHGTAAYLGWSVGLVDWATYVTGWIAATGPTSGQAWFWYATAAGAVLLYRRTRTWWRPVAWLAAVPVTSTVAGVLLYGTPSL